MEGVANFFFEAIQLQSISYQTIFGVAFYKVKRRKKKQEGRNREILGIVEMRKFELTSMFDWKFNVSLVSLH